MTFDLDRIGGLRAYRNLIDEVLACGALGLELARRGAARTAVRKPDRSPVTEADEAIERRLRAYVATHHPDVAFFGEETGRTEGPSDLELVVDPIDGTRAFVRGLPTWSVLVALLERGEPVVGIAYMPAAEDLFTGVRGLGADHNGRPCRVSAIGSLDDAMVSHGGLGQFHAYGNVEHLARLAASVHSTRGFADFDGYRQLLLGRVDAMVDPDVKPYDVAAAALLVTEAGGRFTSLRGEPRIDGGSGLASNGVLHETLLELLR